MHKMIVIRFNEMCIAGVIQIHLKIGEGLGFRFIFNFWFELKCICGDLVQVSYAVDKCSKRSLGYCDKCENKDS